MLRILVLAVILLAPGTSPASQSGDRVLRTVPSAERLVRQHLATEQRALASSAPECTAAAFKGRDVMAARCRILLLRQVAARLDVATADDKARGRALRTRSELAVAALDLGGAVTDFSPVNRAEGLDRRRFEAVALSCQPINELYDALAALPADHPSTAALRPLAGQPAPLDRKPMKEVVCGCSSAAVQLAGAAFVPPSDPLHNETQRALYTRGCFLDVEAGRSSLVDIRRDAPGTGPASLPGRPAAGDRTAEVRRVAASRDFQLAHCKERVAQRRQRSVDLEGLQRCVCEVASKWRFSPADGAASSVELELAPGQIGYSLTLEADGKVSACQVKLVDEKK